MAEQNQLSELHGEAVNKIVKLCADLSGSDPQLAYSLLTAARQQVRFAVVTNLSAQLEVRNKKKEEESR